ncbi:MAG: site-2 protease family protein [Chlamydiota bacterium]
MLYSLLYIVLAAFGLGILVIIHELGHYYMARRVGMTVETFSIGFGKPLVQWKHNGVQWQICWLLFGGYVKIKGMEKIDDKEPSDIPDGYFGRPPWDRIKVALAGPLVNLIFALFLFSLIWFTGGRDKYFSEFTNYIGWVDESSEAYNNGLRPGDQILEYDGYEVKGAKDHLYAPMMANGEVSLAGYHFDETNGRKSYFEYTVPTYPHPEIVDEGFSTIGVLKPARYLIYDRFQDDIDNPLPQGSAMADSGLEYGDRIFWVDGQVIYSHAQLLNVLNDNKILLTIQRGDDYFVTKVPRFPISIYRLDDNQVGELSDLKHASNYDSKTEDLFFIPYYINSHCEVEGEFNFIDEDDHLKAAPENAVSTKTIDLNPGDKIVAVDGKKVENGSQLFHNLQQRLVWVIVQRNGAFTAPVMWNTADKCFNRNIDWKKLNIMANSIGTPEQVTSAGNLHMLKPIVPKKRKDFSISEESRQLVIKEIEKRKSEIAEIPDPEKRRKALKAIEAHNEELLLGISGLQDRPVIYNPRPTTMFFNVVEETWRTLKSLFSGYLNPKWLGGPIGIVQVIHYGWMVGFKEALFWIAVISMNLGILNLLPIPVLDGGHICLAIIESITKKPLKAKTMERLIIPFVILLIGFFIFLSYNDLLRLFQRFF